MKLMLFVFFVLALFSSENSLSSELFTGSKVGVKLGVKGVNDKSYRDKLTIDESYGLFFSYPLTSDFHGRIEYNFFDISESTEGKDIYLNEKTISVLLEYHKKIGLELDTYIFAGSGYWQLERNEQSDVGNLSLDGFSPVVGGRVEREVAKNLDLGLQLEYIPWIGKEDRTKSRFDIGSYDSFQISLVLGFNF
ncbi:outer membrane beta-barrel protein [Vibrio sonorensis]|uniref:outer membrane beta-barrel protein n=1 Tax=Vibrio sonorensis TaxID=1004316 RepID=UPI0008D9D042|nr:outer membrane beta-barrel protein [Vibrio sonorensis]